MTLLPSVARAVALVCLLLSVGGVQAQQYKVVQPDGRVTYTDRPPVTGSARITPMGRNAAPPPVEIGLPIELRQVSQRFPVTLYTTPECPPCDTGRAFLQQRGVPYTERRVANDDDAAALERAVGARTIPSLTIGAQPLRGLSETDWTSYLDAAGYPRDNRLPRGWQPAPAAPLVERAAVPGRTAAAPAEPPPADVRAFDPPPAPRTPAAAPGGVRF